MNTGAGMAGDAGAEVAYCNGAADTPLGRWRAENGHKEPFGVKWWAVGNEMYGKWQIGHMPLEEYVKKHNLVAGAMRRADPRVQLIGVGHVGAWSEAMLAQCADNMHYISEHFYNRSIEGIVPHINQIPANVKRIAAAHRGYRKSIAALEGKDIRIALDEWNYWYSPYVYGDLGCRYFLRDALGIAAGLHEYFRNSDIIFMANYAQTVNVIGCIKTTKTEAAFATTGLVLKLYRNHFGVLPAEVSGAPAPLDVMAAWSEDGRRLAIGVVNPTGAPVVFTPKIAGTWTGGTQWTITGPNDMAYNEPGAAPRVTLEERRLPRNETTLTAPPLSNTLFKLRVKPMKN